MEFNSGFSKPAKKTYPKGYIDDLLTDAQREVIRQRQNLKNAFDPAQLLFDPNQLPVSVLNELKGKQFQDYQALIAKFGSLDNVNEYLKSIGSAPLKAVDIPMSASGAGASVGGEIPIPIPLGPLGPNSTSDEIDAFAAQLRLMAIASRVSLEEARRRYPSTTDRVDLPPRENNLAPDPAAPIDWGNWPASAPIVLQPAGEPPDEKTPSTDLQGEPTEEKKYDPEYIRDRAPRGTPTNNLITRSTIITDVLKKLFRLHLGYVNKKGGMKITPVQKAINLLMTNATIKQRVLKLLNANGFRLAQHQYTNRETNSSVIEGIVNNISREPSTLGYIMNELRIILGAHSSVIRQSLAARDLTLIPNTGAASQNTDVNLSDTNFSNSVVAELTKQGILADTATTWIQNLVRHSLEVSASIYGSTENLVTARRIAQKIMFDNVEAALSKLQANRERNNRPRFNFDNMRLILQNFMTSLNEQRAIFTPTNILSNPGAAIRSVRELVSPEEIVPIANEVLADIDLGADLQTRLNNISQAEVSENRARINDAISAAFISNFTTAHAWLSQNFEAEIIYDQPAPPDPDPNDPNAGAAAVAAPRRIRAVRIRFGNQPPQIISIRQLAILTAMIGGTSTAALEISKNIKYLEKDETDNITDTPENPSDMPTPTPTPTPTPAKPYAPITSKILPNSVFVYEDTREYLQDIGAIDHILATEQLSPSDRAEITKARASIVDKMNMTFPSAGATQKLPKAPLDIPYNEDTDAYQVQTHADYTKLKQDETYLSNAQANYQYAASQLAAAINSGADSTTVENLHTQLSQAKAILTKTKAVYDTSVTKYSYADQGTTNLIAAREKYPKSSEDAKTFNQIQQLETGLKSNTGKGREFFNSYETALGNLPSNISPGDYYDARLRILNAIYAMNPYDQAKQTGIMKPTITEIALPNISEYTTEGDDLEATVDFNKDIEVRENEGEGMARASVVDPAEATLFLNSDREARNQQKMWNDFSRVAPGNSLGSLSQNVLRQRGQRDYNNQFSHTLDNAPRYNPAIGYYQKPYMVETQASLELKQRGNQNQPPMIPAIQNDFGRVNWEEDGFYANSLMSSNFTPERINSNNWHSYDNSHSIYHPELQLSRFHMKGTPIPQPRMNGYDYGVPQAKPSLQGNLLIPNRLNGQDYTPLMRNDNWERPNAVVKNKIDTYQQRIISSRM